MERLCKAKGSVTKTQDSAVTLVVLDVCCVFYQSPIQDKDGLDFFFFLGIKISTPSEVGAQTTL